MSENAVNSHFPTIVRSHGGSLQASRSPGAGTRFHGHLPATPIVDGVIPRVPEFKPVLPPLPFQAVKPDHEPDREMNPLRKKSRILLVEDEEALRGILDQVLTMENHEVVTAANGREAIAFAEVQRFDLVITDLIMPEKEGIETIMELRKKSPDLKIIAMSGGGAGSAQNYLPLARQLGASMTLAKPFDRRALLDAVDDVLSL